LAIEIKNSRLIAYISKIQKQLSPYLHAGYLRQPHIKLAACGLMTAHSFPVEILSQQIKALEQLALTSFAINIRQLSSFSTYPYISISDQTENITNIHNTLTSIFPEDNPCKYSPHITLGLYNDAYSYSDIHNDFIKLSKEVKVDSMTVNSLILAQYKTNSVQGAYQVLHHIPLSL